MGWSPMFSLKAENCFEKGQGCQGEGKQRTRRRFNTNPMYVSVPVVASVARFVPRPEGVSATSVAKVVLTDKRVVDQLPSVDLQPRATHVQKTVRFKEECVDAKAEQVSVSDDPRRREVEEASVSDLKRREALDAALVRMRDEDAEPAVIFDGLSVTSANEKWLATWGYEEHPEEVIGTGLGKMQGPMTFGGASGKNFTKLLAAVKAESPIDTTIVNYKRDGTPKIQRMRMEPLGYGLNYIVCQIASIPADVDTIDATLHEMQTEGALNKNLPVLLAQTSGSKSTTAASSLKPTKETELKQPSSSEDSIGTGVSSDKAQIAKLLHAGLTLDRQLEGMLGQMVRQLEQRASGGTKEQQVDGSAKDNIPQVPQDYIPRPQDNIPRFCGSCGKAKDRDQAQQRFCTACGHTLVA